MTLKKLSNDYLVAKLVDGHNLHAVKLKDEGWSIADGQGSLLTPKNEIELAGWHLPVKFVTQEQAIKAIRSGPHAMFDITSDSVWSKHAVNCGAEYNPSYEM